MSNTHTNFLNFIYLLLFLAVLGLNCCTWTFSLVVESEGSFLVVVRGLLIAGASLVVENGLLGTWAQ